MKTGRYFAEKGSRLSLFIRVFVIALAVFAVVFFLWSVMRYNKIEEEKAEKEAEAARLREEIAELRYLVDLPVDDAYKIRIARERLGMCFPDEIIFYTNVE